MHWFNFNYYTFNEDVKVCRIFRFCFRFFFLVQDVVFNVARRLFALVDVFP